MKFKTIFDFMVKQRVNWGTLPRKFFGKNSSNFNNVGFCNMFYKRVYFEKIFWLNFKKLGVLKKYFREFFIKKSSEIGQFWTFHNRGAGPQLTAHLPKDGSLKVLKLRKGIFFLRKNILSLGNVIFSKRKGSFLKEILFL